MNKNITRFESIGAENLNLRTVRELRVDGHQCTINLDGESRGVEASTGVRVQRNSNHRLSSLKLVDGFGRGGGFRARKDGRGLGGGSRSSSLGP